MYLRSHFVFKVLFANVCCDNEICCPNRTSQVKLLLRPLMPNGFLPPPVKFAQQFSGTALPLKLAKDNLLNKTVRFAALQTRAFYLCSANTAFDTSMQSVTSRTTCDQCFRSLPSKAQKLVYRRALHKFVRQ